MSEFVASALILHSTGYASIADSSLNYSAVDSVPQDTVETHFQVEQAWCLCSPMAKRSDSMHAQGNTLVNNAISSCILPGPIFLDSSVPQSDRSILAACWRTLRPLHAAWEESHRNCARITGECLLSSLVLRSSADCEG